MNYGAQVLSHPLIASAVSEAFLPVFINNRPNKPNADVLSFFKEPNLNNPVLRIIDADRNNVVERLAGDYSVAGLSARLVEALEKRKRALPEYLRLLNAELRARAGKVETAVFGMG